MVMISFYTTVSKNHVSILVGQLTYQLALDLPLSLPFSFNTCHLLFVLFESC